MRRELRFDRIRQSSDDFKKIGFPPTQQQFFDPVLEAKRRQMQAEAALWVAVILEATNCLVGIVPGACSLTQKEDEILKARRWFRSQVERPGSFLWISHALDLDHKTILKRLENSGLLNGAIRVKANMRRQVKGWMFLKEES